ncbi:hypothetical protein Tco_1578753, partial [Tanacetum coccineum]
MLLMQAQENGAVLDEEQLLFIADGRTNTFDDDVDEAPVQDLTMFMTNLSSANLIYDEAGPSYDSDILSEVQDHDAEYTSDSNIIPYEQYVKDNAVQIVQSNVSSMPNDALIMIINDMNEQSAQCVSANEQNKVVNESLTAELARYKEKEELLKKELHSVKMQLNSTINHNKLIKEEVTTLKQDFKQKENKYLEEFLDMKQLKEKVEDKLYKQDQSLQTVHMLCKPKPFYDEKKKVAIGYKNPLYLTKAKQVQPALYNGHELVKTTHAPAVVHDSEDTLEIAEKTRIAEVEQNVVDKQCVDIKRKNLLIQNENLIANWLSNEVLYSVMNDGNIVSRFFEMHDAYTVKQARCLELEAELFKLKHKIQKDDHSEMIKYFSNLEIDHLNLQLKYQNLKERFGNNKSQPSQDTLEFDTVFEINKMKGSLQGKDNAIRKLKEQISQMNEKRSETDRVISSTEASGSKPRRNTKNTRILTPRSDNKKKVEDHPRNNKSNLKQKNRVDSSISSKRTCVVKYLTSVNAPPLIKDVLRTVKQVWKETWKLFVNVGYQWKPTGRKFTLEEQCPLTRFGNDHFGAIMGYGYYVIGDSVISRVYYVEGLGHNLFSVGKFCDSDLEVAFKKHSCYVINEDGVELLKGFRGSNLYTISVEDMMNSTPLHPLKKLDDAEPISGSKTIKSILRSKSTFKAKTLKGVKINKPSSDPANGEAHQAKKAEALKSTKAESSKVNISKTPTR